MKADIKRKWVKALRSGDYKQGFSRLRTNSNCFCVLGVLCNLHAEAHPEIAVTQSSKTKYLNQTHVLPVQVAEWAGSSINPWVVYKMSAKSVTTLNDGNKLSFNELADLIEAQL